MGAAPLRGRTEGCGIIGDSRRFSALDYNRAPQQADPGSQCRAGICSHGDGRLRAAAAGRMG